MSTQELERDGWSLECLFCKESIHYTLINNTQTPIPFFYAEEGSDVLLRKEDELSVEKCFMQYGDSKPPLAVLESLWKTILESAPDAPNGGRFALWSNIKCPHCRKEMPYNGGVKNLELRIYEPQIVLLDGAILLGSSVAESWKIRVRLTT
jgi:hypothetical protein